MYLYTAFGILIKSEILLPALVPYTGIEESDYVTISIGKTPITLSTEPLDIKPFSVFNKTEFLYQIPDILKIFVKNGNEVILEALSGNEEEVLMHLYSNGLAAILFQRGLIPFHVSGVFINKTDVVLFAAPSRTGKSTTAVKMQEKGYPLFTDDTAVLHIVEDQVFAKASYPMVRLWQNSIEEQNHFDINEKFKLSNQSKFEKYGFHFHDNFSTNEFRVAGFVFLEIEGDQLKVESIKSTQMIQALGRNVYRNHWTTGMGMDQKLFKTLLAIANTVPAFIATRPLDLDTFEEFSDLIINEICQPLNQ